MTTITYKDGVMAADTQMIKGTTITGQVIKVVRRDTDGALCGGAGNLNWVQAFHEWFLTNEEGEMPVLSEYDCGLIARKDDPEVEIFEEGGSFLFEPNFTAIGSGKDFAFGAMSAGASADEAVRIACLYDPGTGGEVIVVRHDQ